MGDLHHPRVILLHTPRLDLPFPAPSVMLERKTAATLAFLALNGPTSRARLARMLWPASPPRTARNNFVHLLRKLRDAAAVDVVTGQEVVQLQEDAVSVDLPELDRAGREARFGAFVDGYAALLGTFDYDDCPEFEEWLVAERERLHERYVEALRTLTRSAEADGRLPDALGWAQRLLDAHLVSEEAYALVMSLQYRLGDRPRALETFKRCEDMLRREFGVTPSETTLTLARPILDGDPAAFTSDGPVIPLTVLRPPVLIGREREWQEMEDAWARGQGVCLVGEPGVGKSRLIQEFAGAHGERFYFDCRPGDDRVPYGTTTRLLRKLLRRFPELPLDAWVTQQLARILPEYGAPPPPMRTEADKIRFYQALTDVVRAAIHAGLHVLAYDDTHYFDDSSIEAQLFMWSELGWGDANAPFRIVFNSRPQEYTGDAARALEQLVTTGRVHVIPLLPLSTDATRSLIESIGMAPLVPLTGALQRYSGGNPQFLLETIKHLISSEQLTADFSERVAPPETVSEVIARRFALLSRTAQHVAQAAAVLQADFTPDLVADLLNVPMLDVLPAWHELETAQVITHDRFTHDLVYEAVTDGIPARVRVTLHRNAARVLETRGADAARIARHWTLGEEPLRAVPVLRRAAEAARVNLRFVEAADQYELAATLLAQHGRDDEAFGVWYLLTRDFLKEFDLGERYDRAVRALFDLARTPAQQARARHCHALKLSRTGRREDAAEVARQGLALAVTSGSLEVQSELTQLLGVTLLSLGRADDAVAPLRRAAELKDQLGDVVGSLSAAQNVGVAFGMLGRYGDAAAQFRSVLDAALREDQPVAQLNALTNLAVAVGHQGRKREAAQYAQEALTLVRGMQGRRMNHVTVLLLLADLHRDLGGYREALRYVGEARELSGAYNHFSFGLAQRVLAMLHAAMGARTSAQAVAREALAGGHLTPQDREVVLALLTTLSSDAAELEGDDPGLPQNETKDALYATFLRASALNTEEALPLNTRVVERARQLNVYDVLIAALTQQARLMLRADDGSAALAYAEEAVTLLETYDPLGVPALKVHAMHVAALHAVDDPHAAQARADLIARTRAAAAEQLPPGARQDFEMFILQDLS